MNLKRLSAAFAAALTVATAAFAANPVPAYINLDANQIKMNDADWSKLSARLKALQNGKDTVVRVLHIGDSHIQTEFVTNELRRLLQERYGNAGRGLLMPLRLAGTNQSHDYSATSPLKDWTQTRLLKYPWPLRPGVTGIAAAPRQNTTVTWRTTVPGHTIASAKLLSSKGKTDVPVTNPADSLVTPVDAETAVYGLITENGRPGLVYSAIGNNGACYNDYSLVDSFAAQTRVFQPELIVLSMGTNEAFSYMTDDEIKRSAHDLINALRAYHPQAEFLMLTPMECQRNRNHGHRPLSPYYDINTRNERVVRMLRKVAAEENVPLWDFYAVAGGRGTSEKWLEDKLMNKDRIHLLKPGYELQARLLFDALVKAL